uniref:non-specific serine/threonine protein kinase n=1 Tax=Aplanochytrium stocchinoi TaxID=215587 RepID=A0A7S3LR70_9STRA|eukprot:CAMPEP_0204826902 /NCGR_PEP_ID=MMETSP1346-20131115/4505_1 /ASSEMBLY_ACC=CAM_ASM_000771 /TAXON_ID=215587 /ORGANISM="Aplanochytrium stocchinoi, Strain GSBS06" /LENGTH=624 /DNA_ID=CAMNT_0051955135 /DNA_START=178 /DNA_END=2052 /DNA_ORIENTATION=+
MGQCLGCMSPSAPASPSDFQANLIETKKEASYSDTYADGRTLGEGITGCVKEIYSKSTNTKYAMKSINLARIDKAQMKELETEINILKHLDHPNIVRIFEVYKSRRNMHIVMELLTGGELASRVLKTEKEIISVVTQLLSACKYWHSRGIVHRDLKLENVMFASKDKSSNVKVIDFGLGTTFATNCFRNQLSTDEHRVDNNSSNRSRSSHNENGSSVKSSPKAGNFVNSFSPNKRGSSKYSMGSGSMGRGKDQLSQTKRMLLSTVGTAFYMAPEVVKGSGYTEACDLWAIGVITFMLITLKPPFPGSSEKQIFRNLVYGSPSFNSSRWSKVSPEAKKFVKGLLRPNPDERFTAEEALDHVWLKTQNDNDRRLSFETLDKDVLNSLQRFTCYTKLKKAALMVVAHKSSAHNIEDLRDAFVRMDVQHTGTITFEELKQAMQENNMDIGDEELANLFQGLDMDKSGHIRYLEFLAATVETKSIITVGQLSEAFDHLDEDRSGFITQKNMKKLLGDKFAEEEIRNMISECDANGDKRVSREEFIKMMKMESDKVKRTLVEENLKLDNSDGTVEKESHDSSIDSPRSPEEPIVEVMKPQLRAKDEKPDHTKKDSDCGNSSSPEHVIETS